MLVGENAANEPKTASTAAATINFFQSASCMMELLGEKRADRSVETCRQFSDCRGRIKFFLRIIAFGDRRTTRQGVGARKSPGGVVPSTHPGLYPESLTASCCLALKAA